MSKNAIKIDLNKTNIYSVIMAFKGIYKKCKIRNYRIFKSTLTYHLFRITS